MIRFNIILAFLLIENVPPFSLFLWVSCTTELRTQTVQGATCNLFLFELLLEPGY
jgi:hypothetical protein